MSLKTEAKNLSSSIEDFSCKNKATAINVSTDEKIYVDRLYYDNGTVSVETPFLAPRLKNTSCENKKVFFQCELDDIEHGVVKYFFPCGTIAATKSFKRGVYHGEHKIWYNQNLVKHLCNYKDGIYHGEEKAYFQNGNPEYFCNWEDGELNGNYFEWNSQKRLIVQMGHKKGVLHGAYRRWDDKGKLIVEIFY